MIVANPRKHTPRSCHLFERQFIAGQWRAGPRRRDRASTIPSRMEGRILPIDMPGKNSRVYRSPLGVIGPWNWPMHLAHRPIAPASALGKAVVVKPADDTPVLSLSSPQTIRSPSSTSLVNIRFDLTSRPASFGRVARNKGDQH